MNLASETRTGRTFVIRWRYRLLWCHGCGKRMRPARNGVLTLVDNRLLQWGCIGCYSAARRRAAT